MLWRSSCPYIYAGLGLIVVIFEARVLRLMKIEIHDVDHGGCVAITSPTGERLMLDCGHNLSRPWFPSIAYMGERIETLMLMNLDEDHVQDLEGMCQRTTIGALVSNPTIDASALRAMKPDGMRSGVTMAHEIFSHVGHGFLGSWQHGLGGVQWHAFWNVYGTDFEDTNNLSLAVFVSWGGFTALFGGDLETAGWRRLLRFPVFRQRLMEVKLFVASHHGRENGQCGELFAWCKPEVIVFSDGAKQYGTQETVDWYRQRASGKFDCSSYRGGLALPPMRKVMTTRSDGTITVDVQPDGSWSIRPEVPHYNPVMSALNVNNLFAGLGRVG